MQEKKLFLKNMLDNVVDIAIKSANVFKNAHAENVEKKLNARDLVTEYDKTVQDMIFSSLAALYPSVSLVGEESGELSNYDVENVNAFIVDPIDGTTNFVNGLSHSCVAIAYVEKGEILLAVVYNPYKNDLYTAIKGEGAFVNGKKMSVNSLCMKEGLVGFGTAVYYDELIEKTKRIFSEVLVSCNDLRRMGSAGIDLSIVANGGFSAFFETRLCPWDYAPGILFIQEAGGIISDFDGNPLPLNKRSSVIAGNPIAYKELLEIIQKIW